MTGIDVGRTVLKSLLLLAASFSTGCKPDKPSEVGKVTFDSQRNDLPVLSLWVTPGYTRGPSRAGLLAAVWQDGRLVRAESESTVGKGYVESYLDKQQLAQLLGVVAKLKSPTESDQRAIVDAEAESMTLRTKSGVTSWIHSPGHARSANIVTMKQYLFDLALPAARPVDARPFQTWRRDWVE